MYHVDRLDRPWLSLTGPSADKLQGLLNERAQAGWRLVRHITDERRVLLFFRKTAHFLIFERRADDSR